MGCRQVPKDKARSHTGREAHYLCSGHLSLEEVCSVPLFRGNLGTIQQVISSVTSCSLLGGSLHIADLGGWGEDEQV
jgi:hypothetical protein